MSANVGGDRGERGRVDPPCPHRPVNRPTPRRCLASTRSPTSCMGSHLRSSRRLENGMRSRRAKLVTGIWRHASIAWPSRVWPCGWLISSSGKGETSCCRWLSSARGSARGHREAGRRRVAPTFPPATRVGPRAGAGGPAARTRYRSFRQRGHGPPPGGHPASGSGRRARRRAASRRTANRGAAPHRIWRDVRPRCRSQEPRGLKTRPATAATWRRAHAPGRT